LKVAVSGLWPHFQNWLDINNNLAQENAMLEASTNCLCLKCEWRLPLPINFYLKLSFNEKLDQRKISYEHIAEYVELI